MIRVVATDLDGTLFNSSHTLDEKTYEAILKIQKKGIRFMIVTGRDYPGALQTLEKHKLSCDWIVGSGAEIRDMEGNIIHSIPMNAETFGAVLQRLEGYNISVRFCANGTDYMIGSRDDVVQLILNESRLFFTEGTDEEIKKNELFQSLLHRIKCLGSLQELLDKKILVYKIFISSADVNEIERAREALAGIPDVASASSFINNVELTHIHAQKGPVLKKYIEELGYRMDEVMVLGDSMNDYSMLSMDFGMTVAMENGMDEIKEVVKYVSKSNDDLGVVHAIEKFCE